MPHPKVTKQVLQSYEDHGVAHVPGAFDPAWVADMTKLIDDTIAGLRDGSLRFGAHKYQREVEFEDHDGYVRLISLYWRVPEMRRLVEHSDAAEIVADVIGSDSMQPWIDGTFLKEGDAPETATPWHNDECTFSLRGSHAPSMWVALTDVDLDNAPLQTLSGSHRDPHRYFSTFAVQDRFAERPPNFHPWSELIERVSAPDAPIKVWPAKAGDMLVIHPKTIHASLPRKSTNAGRRLGFSLRWIGSDIRYEYNPTSIDSPWDSDPRVKEGEPIPEAIFPVMWRREAVTA